MTIDIVEPMRRWNGWGDDGTTYPLPDSAARYLASVLGPRQSIPDVSLDQLAATLRVSQFQSQPGLSADPADRVRHARGQSLPDWIALRYGRIPYSPDAVAYPTTDDEVRAWLDYARTSHVRLIPYGGGTSVAGHINPRPDDAPVVTVDLSRMNRLLDLDENSLLATFEAGASGPQIEEQLTRHGYTLGHFPQSWELSTLGGWIATRSSGQQSYHYGRIEDLLAGTHVETPVGALDLPPLPASAAGPDLRQLVLGSEGRFGIITRAAVRVRKTPAIDRFYGIFFRHWESAAEAVCRTRLIESGQVPSTAKTLQARQFFSKGGLLSRWHPNYEFRSGQLEMAEAVESALAEKRHLIVEAGTGTGKTLAYLVPAILSGKRVVVSTGTKNLQEQLFYKDIPFLQKHFPRPVSACYMKGRANYLCRQKVYDAEREPVLSGLEEVADYQVIRDWEQKTETGDRAEIRTLPESSSAWLKLDARGDLCTGRKCQQFERCFLTLMHQRAFESDIIIVNHHLFFADLAVKVRLDDSEGIIPEYDAVIFDEAHEIEDVVGQYFGIAVSSYQFEELIRDVTAVTRRKNISSAELDRILMSIGDHAVQFFSLFGDNDGRRGFTGQAAFLNEHNDEFMNVVLGLELLSTHLKLINGAPEEVFPLVRRADEIAGALKFFMDGSDRSHVYWTERRGRGCFLQATPIEVASILREHLFDEVETVVLTSATLAVSGGFEFAQKRLGLEYARPLVVPSHFDYQTQALLYVPQHLPDPRSPAFTAKASDEVVRILQHSRGRAFVLFTSYQQMRLTYDRVSLDIDYETLMQGTGPRTALLDEFRRTPNCVLFATSSFWQGVDVPGEQLSCVIIDKLPFAVPSDPVVEARIRRIRDEGGEPFYEYQIPQAAIALKQGFGRLIRSRSDRGVLAILDNRITKQRYGQVFFDSLPDYAFTTDIRKVESFFNV